MEIGSYFQGHLSPISSNDLQTFKSFIPNMTKKNLKKYLCRVSFSGISFFTKLVLIALLEDRNLFLEYLSKGGGQEVVLAGPYPEFFWEHCYIEGPLPFFFSSNHGWLRRKNFWIFKASYPLKMNLKE